MDNSTDDMHGFKAMMDGFEEMALAVFAECHDPDKEKMLKNVQQAFQGMREQVEPLSTEAELEALIARAQSA